ncbi:hypothetical protein EC80586_3292, partial [Escherichia coli 8.0586]
MAAIPV